MPVSVAPLVKAPVSFLWLLISLGYAVYLRLPSPLRAWGFTGPSGPCSSRCPIGSWIWELPLMCHLHLALFFPRPHPTGFSRVSHPAFSLPMAAAWAIVGHLRSMSTSQVPSLSLGKGKGIAAPLLVKDVDGVAQTGFSLGPFPGLAEDVVGGLGLRWGFTLDPASLLPL